MMDKDLEWSYEMARTVEFIKTNKFKRVGLQFPDELLKDSVRVVSSLRRSLNGDGEDNQVGLFLMADTAYGSCCVDEVGASHVDADCVVHYGHTCLSPTSKLPALFVFGKSPINVLHCVEKLLGYAQSSAKPILVLYGLDYAHSIPQLIESVAEERVQFARVVCSVMNPLTDDPQIPNSVGNNVHKIGGLVWELPEGTKMENYLLFLIGADNAAFANVVVTYSSCEIVRYDAPERSMVIDLSQQRRILKRRYYLMEKAKDANIVAILVGTLGVAGYLDMIDQMKELITAAGKKVYTLVMGRPNPAKLANFPECDIFIYVSCAQTALLDSKEYLAPVITPFEAMLAFSRGSQWTGEYVMNFRDLINSSLVESRNKSEEPRFSFIQGGYVEEFNQEGSDVAEDKEGALALANATEKALQLRDNPNTVAKRTAKSGAEFLASRSYQGLDIHYDTSSPGPYLMGRSGRAAGYEDEKST